MRRPHLWIVALAALLPLEPMEPLARLPSLGIELNLLELAAGVLLGLAAVDVALDSRLRESALQAPLLAPAVAVAGAFFLSAAVADPPRALPLKFCFRMLAGVAAFVLASAALGSGPGRSRRCRALYGAFVLAGGVSAAIAIGEALAPDVLAPWLAPFREHRFEVGGRPRSTASLAYPNIAGGFLALSLPPALFFVATRSASGVSRALSWFAALALFLAILLTYSRGALIGAAAAAAVFTASVARRLPRGRDVVRLSIAFAVMALGSSLLDPTFRWRASSEGDASWYRAQIEPEESTLSLEPGALVQTGVRVTNAGKLRWESSGSRPFHLSYRWFTPKGERRLEPLPVEGERTSLAEPLAPGGGLSLAALVRAPPEPGRYVLIWDMVQEHTSWFSDKVGSGVPVRVDVGLGAKRTERADGRASPGALRAEIATRAWRPGRRELWGLALSMFRSRPLLGVGPDNFRWLHGEIAGRSSWDRRTNANSLYLELLATAGIVGTAAMLGLVGSACHRLRAIVDLDRDDGEMGESSLAALAAGASLVGFLVHGIFDSLLAFTPIYLALWILLGAASALLRETPA